ncbi:hypothetical protein [Haloferula sp.]|uniref:hypothetical protein n=1 Tax=Haloferula sp. TaxID=2497595 RepID=UPI003C70C05E
MKRYLMILVVSCLPLKAVELDTVAIGRDLNGWQAGDVAWFGTDGLSFRAYKPGMRSLENGTVEIVMKVEQVQKRVAVYSADVRMVVSDDGLVRIVEIDGKVDGVEFFGGEVLRPEPATVGSEEEGQAVDVTPVNAEQEMKQESAQLLDSAIEKARSGNKVVLRDFSSRYFTTKAGETAALAKATGLVVNSLFRRVRP